MSNKKKVIVGIFILLAVIQAFQPARNYSGQVLHADVTATVNVPPSVLNILKRSCYDCHSNNTAYPWYSWIQPGAWFMNNHIKKGKEELNFSDFGSYSKRKQANKFKAIANILRKDEMPLRSYTIVHKNARLSVADKELLVTWSTANSDSLNK